jgi:predicted O-methyltransferase YrrM
MARLPLELDAQRRLDALPELELVEVAGAHELRLSLGDGDGRHAWSLGAAEQIALQLIVAGRQVHSAFEIGTFNGGTTRVLAESLPADGRVVTIDLPPRSFDATQSPEGVTSVGVGAAYRSSPAGHKVEQLYVDSLSFDPRPYAHQFDLVLVDGGHEYIHGLTDTRTALELVSAHGIILWDDFAPYWHGLVRGICESMQGRRLGRLAGTSLGVYLAGT